MDYKVISGSMRVLGLKGMPFWGSCNKRNIVL